MPEGDIELTVAALEACGYRVRVREKNYTRWVAACKGLDVKYVTWHPLTNINQAMQLLIDAPGVNLILTTLDDSVTCSDPLGKFTTIKPPTRSAQDLINAQCRAIVSACASLKAVR